MATISRRQYDHPALATAGGSALHASIENLYTLLGNDAMSRYKAFSAVANSSVGVIAHEFGLDFANLKVQILTGTYPALTLVSDPIGSGWTVTATTGLESRSIDVTAPSSGGPHTYAVIVTHESNGSPFIPGIVSIGAQSFAGAKTFLSTIVGSISGNAGTVTTNANLTGHITSTGNAAVLGSFTSAHLLAALTNPTGTGSAVFATSPTFVTPILGTPASGVATNLTGTASGLTAGTVTTNANLTGDVTSTGNATTLATVNSNVGSFGSATSVTALTVNAKGLITAAASTAIQLTSSAAVTGLDTALSLKAPLESPTFTTTINIPDGSVTVPSIAFTSDADGTGTGIYLFGANQIGFAGNGVVRAYFDSLGRWNFPLNNTHTFGSSTNSFSGTNFRVNTSAGESSRISILIDDSEAFLLGSGVAFNSGASGSDAQIRTNSRDFNMSCNGGTNIQLRLTTAGVVTIGQNGTNSIQHIVNKQLAFNSSSAFTSGSHIWLTSNTLRFNAGTSGIKIFSADNTVEIVSISNTGACIFGATTGGGLPILSRGYNNVDGTPVTTSSANGYIKIGDASTYAGVIQFSELGNTFLYIDSLMNSDLSEVHFRTKTASTALVVGMYTGEGAWVFGANGTTPTHRLNTSNASTVGAAGGASALPATPTGYISININGTNRKIPYYAT